MMPVLKKRQRPLSVLFLVVWTVKVSVEVWEIGKTRQSESVSQSRSYIVWLTLIYKKTITSQSTRLSTRSTIYRQKSKDIEPRIIFISNYQTSSNGQSHSQKLKSKTDRDSLYESIVWDCFVLRRACKGNYEERGRYRHLRARKVDICT